MGIVFFLIFAFIFVNVINTVATSCSPILSATSIEAPVHPFHSLSLFDRSGDISVIGIVFALLLSFVVVSVSNPGATSCSVTSPTTIGAPVSTIGESLRESLRGAPVRDFNKDGEAGDSSKPLVPEVALGTTAFDTIPRTED